MKEGNISSLKALEYPLVKYNTKLIQILFKNFDTKMNDNALAPFGLSADWINRLRNPENLLKPFEGEREGEREGDQLVKKKTWRAEL